MATSTLRITIESAFGLANRDGAFAGKSDPYCIVQVQGKKDQVLKTPVINNSLEPQWNFTGEIQGYVETDVLEFEVWDKDTFPMPDQTLGKVALGAQDFYPYGIQGGLLLADAGSDTAQLNVVIEVIPDGMVDPAAMAGQQPMDAGVQPGQGQEGQQLTLEVSVLSAHNLKNLDGFMAGKSDPYVICEVPGQATMKFQTPVVQNNLDPEWNHTDLIRGFMMGDALEFQVWNKNNFPMPDNALGKVTIGADEFYANPYGFDADLPLEGKNAENATLTVKVLVHQGDVQPADHAQPVPETEPGAVPEVAGTSTTPEKVKLLVEILGGLDLPHKEGFGQGKADLYCICTVPGSGGLLHKAKKLETSVIKDNTSPQWNYVGEIPGFAIGSDTLEFEVWDKNSFPMPDRSAGKVTLSPEDFVANPQGLEGELPLTSDKGEAAGQLAVRVQVLPDGPTTTADSMPSAEPIPAGSYPQAGIHNIAEGGAGSVPIGASYHGGILVSERWGPLVPTGSQVGGPAVSMPAFQPMPMPYSPMPVPMPTLVPMQSMTSVAAAPSMASAAPTTYTMPAAAPAPAARPAPTLSMPSMPSMQSLPMTMTMPAASVGPAPAPAPMPASMQSMPMTMTMPTASAAPAVAPAPMPAYSAAPAPAPAPVSMPAPMPSMPMTMTMPTASAAPAVAPAPMPAYSAAPAPAPAPVSMPAPMPSMPMTMTMPTASAAPAVAPAPMPAYSSAPLTSTVAPPSAATVSMPSPMPGSVGRQVSSLGAVAMPRPAASFTAAPGAPAYTTMSSVPTAAAPPTTAFSGMTSNAAAFGVSSGPITYAAPGVGYSVPAAASGRASLFDQLDRNHDGKLSRGEFESALR